MAERISRINPEGLHPTPGYHHVAVVEAGRTATGSALGPAFSTASTLVGVCRLGFTGQLVEVDLTAALAPVGRPPGPPA